MAENKLCFAGFLLLIFSCGKPQDTSSRIHRIIDSLGIEPQEKLILYRVNPNDCFSCLNGLASTVRSIEKKNITQIFFIKVEREVEKRAIKIDFVKPDEKKIFVWSASLFRELGSALNFQDPISTLHYYDYSKDSVLFSSKIKELYAGDSFIKTIN